MATSERNQSVFNRLIHSFSG